MTSKIFWGASSKCSTKDLLFDDSSSESTTSTRAWAAATSRVWSSGEPDGRIFHNYYWQSKIKTKDRILTGLGSLQLFLKPGIFFLKLWLFFFKSLNLPLHIIKFQMMLLVGFIKLVPSSKRCIQSFGNYGILLLQGFSDYLQSYTKPETSRKIDWQHPMTYKARLVRCQ